MKFVKTIILLAIVLLVSGKEESKTTRDKRQQIAYYPRRGNRPPPYAVQMEPIVQYSQRDPLYNPSASSKNDDFAYHDDPSFYNHYTNEPEPIIEIIIKESNESLPTPVPPPVVPQVKPTKEPIQVFYVKYEKKKGYGDSKPRVVYDPPVPALNPVEEHEVIKSDTSDERADELEKQVAYVTEAPSKEPSTTLRTIIRPESEVYHSGSSGIRVTFGTDQVPPNNHNKRSDVNGPSSNATGRASSPTSLPPPGSPKRQHGPYHPLQPVNPRVPLAFPQQRIVHSFPPQQQLPPNFPGSHQQFQPPSGGPLSARPPQQPPITIQGLPDLQQRLPFQNFGPPHRISINHPQQPGFPHSLSVSHQSVHIQNQPPSLLPSNNFNRDPQPPHVHQQQQQQPQQQHPPQQHPPQQHPPQQHPPQQHPPQQHQQQQHPQQPLLTYKQQELEKQRYHQEQRRQQELRYREQQRQQEQQRHLDQQRQQEQQRQLDQQRQQENHRKLEQSRIIEQQRPLEQQRQQQDEQQRQRVQEEQLRLQEQQRYHSEQQQRRKQEQESKLLREQQYRQQLKFEQSQTINNQPYNQQLQQPSQHSKPGGEIFKAVPKLEQHYAIRENPLHPGPFPPNPQIQSVQYPEVGQNQFSPTPQSSTDLQQQQYFLRNPTNISPSISPNQQQHQQQQQEQQQQQLQLQQHNSITKNQNYQNDQQSFFTQNLPRPQLQRPQTSSQQSIWGRPVFQESNKDKIYATPLSNSNDIGPTSTARTIYSSSTSVSTTTTTTPAPTTISSSTTLAPKNEAKIKENIANLPDEVPDDIREQLLSSGILGNADIQILDYDKVGGIPIENLPPEALANFYGAGGSAATAASEPIPAIAKRPKNVAITYSQQSSKSSKKSSFGKVEHATLRPGGVEMKVVHFDPNTAQGQAIADQHIREDATHLKPVSISTRPSENQQYNRYLPLKVSGASFPIPDAPELQGRKISSVVVLAPVDYSGFREDADADLEDVREREDNDESRQSRMLVGAQPVKFLAGDSLKQLVKKPSAENYKKWLEQESHTEPQRQSVVLLVTTPKDDSHGDKEIFMYDVSSQIVSKLSGDLSSAFVNAAESNSDSPDNIDDSAFATY